MGHGKKESLESRKLHSLCCKRRIGYSSSTNDIQSKLKNISNPVTNEWDETSDDEAKIQQINEIGILALQQSWFKAAREGNIEKLKNLYNRVIEYKLDERNYYLFSYAKVYALELENVGILQCLSELGMADQDLIRPVILEDRAKLKLLTPPGDFYNINGIQHFSNKVNGVNILPLIYALKKKNEVLAKLLIEHSTFDDLSSYKYYLNRCETSGSALTCAIENGMSAAVRLLIEKGDDIETKCSANNFTPILLAAQLENMDIVSILLQNCPNLKACDRNGKNALDLTNSNEIRNLILSSCSYSQCLNLLHFEGQYLMNYLIRIQKQ